MKWEVFPLGSGTRQGCMLLFLFFNTVLELRARAFGEKKRINSIKIGKEEVKIFMIADYMNL